MCCDCNVLFCFKGEDILGMWREIKNVNFFCFVEKVINVEIEW